jgi:YaiO family outer membrane protein
MVTRIINKSISAYFLLIISIASVNLAMAQTPDETLTQSRELVSQKKYDEALLIVNNQLIPFPDNYDLLMIQSRIHGWQSKFKIAQEEIAAIILRWPDNTDALDLEIDLFYWSGDLERMLHFAEVAIRSHPDFPEFQYKRAIALERLGKLGEANEQINKILKKESVDERFISLGKLIREKMMQNSIQVSYRFSQFDRRLKNWHTTTISYSRNTSIGPIAGRINYGNRFSISELQYESDFYPKFSKHFYSSINMGFSGGKIFPEFHGGTELFYILPFACEVSVGMRYLNYKTNEVFIYTATLGAYLKNYWFSTRPIVIQLGSTRSFTINLSARKYLSGKDHYFGASFTRGNAPSQFVSLQEIQRLTSTQEGVEYQHKFNVKTFVKLIAEHQREEYVKGQFQHRYSVEVALIKSTISICHQTRTNPTINFNCVR